MAAHLSSNPSGCESSCTNKAATPSVSRSVHAKLHTSLQHAENIGGRHDKGKARHDETRQDETGKNNMHFPEEFFYE